MRSGCFSGSRELSANVSFLTPVQEDIKAVEKLMQSQADGHHSDLKAALDILLAAGGKRIRPSVILLTGHMLGANQDQLITLAAAIELLHTATLVHDDLIDNSLLRRGVPTLNSKWSPAATVLTGDFLFARAAKLASETDSVAVMKLFSKTLSTIVNGEITQLFNSRCIVSRENYHQRIYAKTASLFETSTWSAALISSANSNDVEKMRRYGYNIGVAFQIVDDIFDFIGNPSAIGKPIGNDLRQGLITLPVLNYIERHRDDPDALYLMENNCPQDEDQLQRLTQSIIHSSAIDQSFQEANQFVQQAIENVKDFPESLQRDSLISLAHYITERRI
jgi:geranylgeranyl pyrophosphate synthase